jgi:hypothetical protein
MYMYQLWSLSLEHFTKVAKGITGPCRVREQGESLRSCKAFRFVIASLIQHNVVAVIAQHLRFLADNNVLSSRLLVPVVSNNDLHSVTDSQAHIVRRSP